MIPVTQTPKECFAACVASILELQLEDVPLAGLIQHQGKTTHAQFWKTWDAWLRERNLGLLAVDFNPEADDNDAPVGYSIQSQRVSDDEWDDRVHARVCLDGEVIFDPSPVDGNHDETVGVVLSWFYFQVLDPSKPCGKYAACTQYTQPIPPGVPLSMLQILVGRVRSK